MVARGVFRPTSLLTAHSLGGPHENPDCRRNAELFTEPFSGKLAASISAGLSILCASRANSLYRIGNRTGPVVSYDPAATGIHNELLEVRARHCDGEDWPPRKHIR